MKETKRTFAPKLAALYLGGSVAFAFVADYSLTHAGLSAQHVDDLQVYFMIGFIIVSALLIYVIAGLYGKRLVKMHEERMKSNMAIAHRLALAIELRDDHASGHNHRLGRYCQILGREMGMEDEEAEQLYHAAALHDVGKIGVPDEILNKPGPLTEPEIEIIRRHVELGSALLANSDDVLMQLAHRIVLTHHENWDGTGYPNGLIGDQIPLEGRIVAVADVYDALHSARPYKAAWPLGKVCEEIQRLSGSKFDPRVVEAFLNCREAFVEVDQDETPAPWLSMQSHMSAAATAEAGQKRRAS
ncbi:MAG: HD-GYP domain-containing protein [Fimbriimonas sp.]